MSQDYHDRHLRRHAIELARIDRVFRHVRGAFKIQVIAIRISYRGNPETISNKRALGGDASGNLDGPSPPKLGGIDVNSLPPTARYRLQRDTCPRRDADQEHTGSTIPRRR